MHCAVSTRGRIDQYSVEPETGVQLEEYHSAVIVDLIFMEWRLD